MYDTSSKLVSTNWLVIMYYLLLFILKCSILLRSLGEAGEIEGESEAILLENDVNFADFSKYIIDSLPQLPWSIPKVTKFKINMI